MSPEPTRRLPGRCQEHATCGPPYFLLRRRSSPKRASRRSRLLPVVSCLAGAGLLIGFVVSLLNDVVHSVPELPRLQQVRQGPSIGEDAGPLQQLPSRTEEEFGPFLPPEKAAEAPVSPVGEFPAATKTSAVVPNKGAVQAPAAIPAVPRPMFPRHYPHIRLAMLAFQGNPMGRFEDRLLRKSVDLVIPHVTYLEHIKAVAPRTPRL